MRNVNTDGSLNNNNAINGNGAAVDCENLPVSSSRKTKAAQLTQGAVILSRKGKQYGRRESLSRSSLCKRPCIFKCMSYKEVISFENLYKGLKEACKNIRWKDSTVGYEHNALRNTYKLRRDLLEGKYKIDRYQRFTIYEPKKRDIVATRLKDRQFQRSLCDNGLYEQITKSFIPDNCACMRGRGVDYTLNRITAHLRKYRQRFGPEGWVLKCDIHHYFQSIRHDVAKEAICKRVKDPEIAFRACEIVESFGDVGIGLGSQVSQLVALAVLDDLDHFIKERLKVKYYVRYMDDMVLIDPDKEFLRNCWKIIEQKLAALGLELNKKTCLYPLKQGVKMLQWKFIITSSGRIVRKMNKNKQSRQRRKLRKIYEKERSGEYAPGTAFESLKSWLANASRGDTYYERIKMIEFYNNLEVNYNAKHGLIQETCQGGSGSSKAERGAHGDTP